MKRITRSELKEFLDEKVWTFNKPDFIHRDPISIPHRFSKKEDIEISGFLSATIAWGQRSVILKNANALLVMMDEAPHDFILNFSDNDLKPFQKFVHRTFNGVDCIYFLKALQKIYREKKSLESLFKLSHNEKNPDFKQTISQSRSFFFSLPHPARTLKHFANPVEGSAAKRINMFLRWNIRKDKCGVDFGIWNLDPAHLICPLDVHSARVARKLGLLNRKQNDWQAALELTNQLKKFDPLDPVKYDFALFGLGVSEKF